MSLGENIYHLRSDRKLSQADLADYLEVSRQSVSKWENDIAIPELDKLMKLSQLFGITLDQLVGDATAVQAPPSREAAPAPKLSGHKVAGVILLCCAFISFVAFTILGVLIGFHLLGLFLALPFILTGVVFLTARNHVAFYCCWALYIPLGLSFLLFMIISLAGAAAMLIGLVSLIPLIVLTIWTLFLLWKGKLTTSFGKKVLVTILLFLLLIVHILLLQYNYGFRHGSQPCLFPSQSRGCRMGE